MAEEIAFRGKMSMEYFDASYGRLITIEQKVLNERIQVLRKLMEENCLGGILIVEPDDGGYRGWLTGTCKLDRFSEGGILLPQRGPLLLVTGSKVISGDNTILEYKTPYHYCETNGFDITRICTLLQGNIRLGVVHMPQMRAGLYDELIRRIDGLEIVDVTEQADFLKACKSTADVLQMEKLAQKADRIFQKACSVLEPGTYERDAVNELRFYAYQLGCYGNDDGISSRIRLVAGKEKDSDILYPGKIMKKGETVSLSVHFAGDDSCYGAMARSYFLGEEPGREEKELWSAVVEMQHAAARCLLPGRTVREAAAGAENVLREYGYKEKEGCLIAGIGYGIRERPKVSDCSKDWRLRENMVLFVAAAAEGKEGFGMCCGDMYVVRDSGACRLNRFPQELISVG